MGNSVSNDDTIFSWEYTDQPHADRRLQILRKHPEIKKYMKANGDPWMALVGILMVFLQLFLGYLNTQIPLDTMLSVRFFFNIFVGSWVASWLLISLHEAAHCLLFGASHPRLNRWYGIFANIVLIIPLFTYFKRHHRRHHKFLGNKDFDAEFPSAIEAHIFSKHAILKYFWMVYNPILQHFRSAFMGDGTRDWMTWEEFINVTSCFSFTGFLFYMKADYFWTHFALSTFVALGTNMFGIWAMIVHCLYFDKEGTVSYYGWMNPWILNFGYHMEHHDFPNVPARFLPEIRRIAPEFYEEQHYLDDIYAAVLQWLHDPRLGLFSRLKRDDGGKALYESMASSEDKTRINGKVKST